MPSERIVYLSIEDVLRLHERAIGRYGGMAGVHDRGALESSVAQPQTCVYGQERHSTLSEKAAAYCFFITRNHPFFDGNKRTGLLAALYFLTKNGVAALSLDREKVYEVVLAVASGEAEMGDLETVFREACQS